MQQLPFNPVYSQVLGIRVQAGSREAGIYFTCDEQIFTIPDDVRNDNELYRQNRGRYPKSAE
jgi:hypothetical protein